MSVSLPVNGFAGGAVNTYPQGATIQLIGNGVQNVSMAGEYFFILTATGSFNISIDGQQEIPMQAGLAIPAGKLFNNLLFRDTSGAINVITFLVSTQEIRNYPPSQAVVAKDAPTGIDCTTYRIGGNGGGKLPGNTTVTFTGISTGLISLAAGKTRRSIAITNEDVTPIEVWDNAGNPGVTIYPSTTDIFFVSGVVKIRNPNGASVNVTVEETFYL
jgi:hypothetical protein